MNDFFTDPACLAPAQTCMESRGDGAFVLRAQQPLQPYSRCIGEWLERWAIERPDQVFLAERRGDGWFTLSYQDARRQVGELAEGLLALGLRAGQPVLMLSDNDIEQALLALAALHIGIPVANVSVAYSRASQHGHSKLKAIVDLLQPGVIFVSDAAAHRDAIRSIQPHCRVVASRNSQQIAQAQPLSALFKTETAAVLQAFVRVDAQTPARYLLTSGSTGTPKAVVNTHGMLCANQQAIAQCWRFIERCELVVLDWLPWSHTFGVNHNFNLVLRNGGSFYIDDGRPLAGQIERTVENIKAIRPTLYFNVPRGYDTLLPFLERDKALARALFGRLQMLFYAAASLPMGTWSRLLTCCANVRPAPLFFASSWGATETSPTVTNVHFRLEHSGNIGVPVPGAELKFTPDGDKFEMSVRGPCVFTRYLNDPVNTAMAFDKEGFFRIGDSGYLANPEQPERGIVFDGRIAEDFKLTSGTWVSVGALRLRIINALAPFASDCVICGHDQDEVTALVYPSAVLLALAGDIERALDIDALAQHPSIRHALGARLQALASESPAPSKRPARLLFLGTPPSLEAGEITDKGYINQRKALSLRADQVKRLYAATLDPAVILLDKAYGENV